MSDTTICHDQQLNMWYIQRDLHIEEIFPLTLEYIRDQQEENAKLRELVRIAVKHCDSGTCDGCPIQGESGSCPYSDMARELGVEV